MGHFWRTDLLRTRSEALICDEVFFFFNHKILFVVFTYIPGPWILLSPVVNLIFLMLMRNTNCILLVLLFRSVPSASAL